MCEFQTGAATALGIFVLLGLGRWRWNIRHAWLYTELRGFPRFLRKKTWVKGKHHIPPRWTFGIRRRGFVSTACSEMIGKVEEEPIADPFVIFLILYIYQFHH